jgi:hypothetical protein
MLFSVVSLIVLSSPATSQIGWTNLTNTKLQDACPADFFGGQPYEFSYYCPGVIRAWSGGVADTLRNRLIVWGGGHMNYFGNEMYSLNLSSDPPSLTRLTDPSPINTDLSNCTAALSDGKPNARETYNGLVYMPHVDRMFVFAGALACGNGETATDTWTLDMNTLEWQRMDPVAGSPVPADLLGNEWSVADYDPNSRTVLLAWTDMLWRYTYETNSYDLLAQYGDAHVPYTSTGVIDPKRQLFIFMGHEYHDVQPKFLAIDISPGSTYQVEDWTSQVIGCDALATGCDGDNAESCTQDYAGLAYDPTRDRIVGWPGTGDTVYLFNPDTKTCEARTFPNGPRTTLTTGTFGRFRYFPLLDAFGAVFEAGQDASFLSLDPETGSITQRMPSSTRRPPSRDPLPREYKPSSAGSR